MDPWCSHRVAETTRELVEKLLSFSHPARTLNQIHFVFNLSLIPFRCYGQKKDLFFFNLSTFHCFSKSTFFNLSLYQGFSKSTSF